ncbi:olfactory receptor 14A16-like [Sarcoramphus papa]
MYFFLLNLSLLDLGSISTTLPKARANSLWDTRAISYLGCAAQVFLFVFLMSAEFYLLTIMTYDRYVAICKPLHYGTLLGSRACVHMAAAAWGSGFLHALLHTANTFSLPLCQGNALNQFFCEIPQILKLSCSQSYLREFGLLVVSVCFSLACFVFIVLSSVQIFRAVLRIPSEQGQHKAFSTCLPHLAVVSLFLSTVMFAYLKAPSISSPSLDLVVSFLYSVVPPAVNPLIYSMRNKEIKDALRNVHEYTLFQEPCSLHRERSQNVIICLSSHLFDLLWSLGPSPSRQKGFRSQGPSCPMDEQPQWPSGLPLSASAGSSCVTSDSPVVSTVASLWLQAGAGNGNHCVRAGLRASTPITKGALQGRARRLEASSKAGGPRAGQRPPFLVAHVHADSNCSLIYLPGAVPPAVGLMADAVLERNWELPGLLRGSPGTVCECGRAVSGTS